MRIRVRSTAWLLLSAGLVGSSAVASAQPYSLDFQTDLPHLVPDGGGADCVANVDNLLLNCSFESGDFTDWVVADITSPFLPLTVAGPSYIGYGFFVSAPTQGVVSALTGFDGMGPGTIELGQDVMLPADSTVSLEFDYRGAWDLATFGATMDRTFEVHVEPSGGGAPMQTDLIATAATGTLVTDTGLMNGSVDLSPFSGQAVRVNFVWTVSEAFSGPGLFELDNVQLTAEGIEAIPALDTVGLSLLFLLLAGAGVLLLRRWL